MTGAEKESPADLRNDAVRVSGEKEEKYPRQVRLLNGLKTSCWKASFFENNLDITNFTERPFVLHTKYT